jgi:O-antigen/teichoic acid export membrane protein
MSEVGRELQGPAPGAGERRSATRGVVWGGVESTSSALVGLVLTPLIVRILGLDGLGLWSACWSLSHTAGLADCGVGAAYARFTARAIATRDRAALNATVAAGTGFHLALAALAGSSALLLGPAVFSWIAPQGRFAADAPAVLACTLATVLLRLVTSAYRGVVAGAQRLDLLGRVGSAAALLEGAGAGAALSAGLSIRGMALNSLFVALLQSVAEGAMAHRLCPGLRVRPFAADRATWREVLGFGARLQATRAAEILSDHAPRIALALGPGLAAAGTFDLASRLVSVIRVAGRLPLPVVQPLATRLEARGDRERLRLLVERATRYVALLILPGTILILADAPALLLAWTGREAPPGTAAAARLLVLAAGLAFLVSPVRLALRGLGRAGLETSSAAAGSLLHLALAVLLARRFGAEGVAAAALCGALLSVGVLDAGARRSPALLPGGSAWRALTGALLAGAASLSAVGAWRLARAGAAQATRGAALSFVLPDVSLVLVVFTATALVTGGLRRDDLGLVRDLLPGAGATPAESPLPGGTGGTT